MFVLRGVNKKRKLDKFWSSKQSSYWVTFDPHQRGQIACYCIWKIQPRGHWQLCFLNIVRNPKQFWIWIWVFIILFLWTGDLMLWLQSRQCFPDHACTLSPLSQPVLHRCSSNLKSILAFVHWKSVFAIFFIIGMGEHNLMETIIWASKVHLCMPTRTAPGDMGLVLFRTMLTLN